MLSHLQNDEKRAIVYIGNPLFDVGRGRAPGILRTCVKRVHFHKSMDPKTMLATNIIDLLGLQSLPEGRKADLVNRMAEVVQDRISERVHEALSAEDRTQLDAMIDGRASEDEVNAFLQKAVPDFNAIAGEEVLRFKQQMASDVATVRKIALAA